MTNIHGGRDRLLPTSLVHARDLASKLVRALDAAAARDPDLGRVHVLNDARLLVTVLYAGHALDDARSFFFLASRIPSRIASAIALDRDGALADNLGPAFDFARQLEGLLAPVSAAASSNGQLRVPMRLAGWLAAFAARLLPGAEQVRYREEFGSELAEIARAGGGRRAQLAYAARTVLSSAWQLRAALRSPRRRGAVQ